MKEKNDNRIGAIIIVLVLAWVPLIVSAKKFSVGLSGEPWFSNGDVSYDFFLYWKSQALFLMCGILSLYILIKVSISKQPVMARLERRYWIPLGIYFVMSLLSTLMSEHGKMAVWGGYEQWEGMLTIGAYVVLLYYASTLLLGKNDVRIVRIGLLAGTLVMSVLGAGQYFEHDFFRTSAGKFCMNLMSSAKLNFSFNFDPGRVYATLHNPNYVGSYVVLMFPLVLSIISLQRKKSSLVCSLVAALTALGLLLMLVGSESVTGFIGLSAAALLFLIVMSNYFKRHPWYFAGVTAVCLVAVAIMVICNQSVFEYGFRKITSPTPNQFVVKSMVGHGDELRIQTAQGNLLSLTADQGAQGSMVFHAADENGSAVELGYDDQHSYHTFLDERYQGIRIQEANVDLDGKETPAFTIHTPSVGKKYTVVVPDKGGETSFRMVTPFEKTDRLREIPSLGFDDNLHFASRRGYIWSRTFPLLKDHVLLGSGPNTFVYEFPNDDYVGMKNVGYDGLVVTKPHNMYLQIFVQTGFLSLIAFVGLYVLYFVQCVKLYSKMPQYGWMERFGIGIFLGTFGYLVTGIANDSCVAVAPLYWCLLGVGVAVNRLISEKMRGEYV